MTATIHQLRPKRVYAVVENAGGDDPRTVHECNNLTKAYAFCKRMYEPDEIDDLDVMVMLVLPDGSHTTEY